MAEIERTEARTVSRPLHLRGSLWAESNTADPSERSGWLRAQVGVGRGAGEGISVYMERRVYLRYTLGQS